MRLKEAPAVKKHIHSWKLDEKRVSPLGGGWLQCQRSCADCKTVQWADISPLNVVPDSCLHLADENWFNGKLSPKIDFSGGAFGGWYP